MKVCAVQFKPVPGAFSANLKKHLALVRSAASHGADVVFFPELSLTGYEPRLAKELANQHLEAALQDFQRYSDEFEITIGVGLPLLASDGVQIAMIWHSPHENARKYAKQHLHSDELPFFTAAQGQLALDFDDEKLVPAICYESLLDEHASHAGDMGATAYLASVAKSPRGVQKAMSHYPAIARRFGMFVLMANSVGPSDNFLSHGHTAAWSRDGHLLAQLDAESEGLVILNMAESTATTHVKSADECDA
jgi:predicted amidohydrolase